MHVFGRKLGLISALSIVAFAGGCRGFFVNATLSSLAVGPTATIQTKQTVQMIATATFSDGTTSNAPSNLFWSSSDTTVATISANGLVTGIGQGTATITAASGSVSGTATVTVTIGNITSLTIKTVPPGTTSVPAGNSVNFQALANTAGGQTNVDVTSSVTWAVNAGNITGASITNGSSPVTLSTTSGGGTGQIAVTATDPTSGTQATYNLNVQ